MFSIAAFAPMLSLENILNASEEHERKIRGSSLFHTLTQHRCSQLNCYSHLDYLLSQAMASLENIP